jgi:hypothetical protein
MEMGKIPFNGVLNEKDSGIVIDSLLLNYNLFSAQCIHRINH